MTDFRELCAELVDAIDASRPYATPLLDRARAALAEADGPAVQSREPASVTAKPTDEDLWSVADSDFRANSWPTDAIKYARAVLARWGNYPAIPDSSFAPIPVSERLPGAGDCDAEGRCWWWYAPVPEQTYGYWLYEDNATERALDEWPTHWLPAHALPLPSSDESTQGGSDV